MCYVRLLGIRGSLIDYDLKVRYLGQNWCQRAFISLNKFFTQRIIFSRKLVLCTEINILFAQSFSNGIWIDDKIIEIVENNVM